MLNYRKNLYVKEIKNFFNKLFRKSTLNSQKNNFGRFGHFRTFRESDVTGLDVSVFGRFDLIPICGMKNLRISRLRRVKPKLYTIY